MKKVLKVLMVWVLMVMSSQAGAQFTGGSGRGDIASAVFLGYISLCNNPTAGGTITAVQTLCSGDDPASFSFTALPTGHTGDLEYQWQFSITSDATGFSDIAGATSTVYDAPPVTQTTWYQRVARVSCMDDWSGAIASNVLKVTVNPLPAFTFVHSDVLCSGSSDGTITINASGGSGSGYEYRIHNGSSWSAWQTGNAFSGLPTGNYTIEIRDGNGCVQINCTP